MGDLSRCGYESLKEFFRVAVPDEEATPGAIESDSDLRGDAQFHPHLHCLVTDGCFGQEGIFYRLPSLVDMDLLTDLFRHKVLPSLRSIANWKLEIANLKFPISNLQFPIRPRRGRMLLSQGKVTEALRQAQDRPW